MNPSLDPRLNAIRPDLADARLRDRVEAPRYAEGQMRAVAEPFVDLKREPRPDSGTDTQLLLGDRVRLFDEVEDWAWVQAERDGYVGYLGTSGLAPLEHPASGKPYLVSVPHTFVYAEPDLKRQVVAHLSMGSLVHVTDLTETRGTTYARLSNGGFCPVVHLRPETEPATDYVAIAELFLHAPYLWGGTSGFGIDCSGLVQLSMRMVGQSVLRDTDMQAATIGQAIDPAEGLRRGDLVFWDGHVGIMRDGSELLHANGHTMTVASEPLEEAKSRIAPVYGQVTGFRRPKAVG